jgi:phosphoglycerol transferase MdoB-like AlkP superfamily enzyme
MRTSAFIQCHSARSLAVIEAHHMTSTPHIDNRRQYNRQVSTAVFLAELCFGLLIYTELLVQSPAATLADYFLLGSLLPWVLWEYLLLISLPALVPWLRLPHWISTLLILASTSLINLYLICDLVYFSLFSQHISLVAGEGKVDNLGNLFSSFRVQITGLAWLNIAAAIGVFVYILKALKPKATKQPPGTNKPVAVGLTLWLAAAVSMPDVISLPRMNVVSSLLTTSQPLPNQHTDTEFGHDLFKPVAGAYQETMLQRQQLAENRELIAQHLPQHPNIVFIVLESVGSLQLLPDGKVNPTSTPFMAALGEKSLTLDNLYTFFPSTARSHIPMLTGGNIITWGSVHEEFDFPYNGSNLVSDLKALGYSTGLFSSGDLGYENRYAFYKHLPFDQLAGSNTFSKEERRQHRLNSWGVREEFAWSKAFSWLKTATTTEQPFFLHYMTVATHHPYDVPKGIDVPFDTDILLHKYQNALRYTDQLIQNIFQDLQAAGLDKNTLVVISGDHGEAFGERHRGNFTHKNYLFEENIRTFLLIALADGTALQPQVLARPGSVADIAPTIMRLAGGSNSHYPHTQDLLADTFEVALNFFHKGTFPQQWGVRDGQWKFIENIRDGKPQLYNLATDPGETHNLAENYPRQVDLYHKRAEHWFIAQNHRFRRELAGFQPLDGAGLVASDLKTPGPKTLKMGLMDNQTFIPKDAFHQEEAITSWIRLVPYDQDTQLTYWWISPSGQEIHISKFMIKKGWTTARLGMPKNAFSEPLKGEWTLVIKNGQQELQQQTFTLL